MYNLIERYMNRITKEDINNFALSKNITLSESELDFTYDFAKKNYQNILANPTLFNINRYKSHYTEENFNKIVKVYNEYFQKYANYL